MTSMGFSLGVWNILLHGSAPPDMTRESTGGVNGGGGPVSPAGLAPRPQRGIGCYGADKFSPGEAGTFCGALAVTRR